jgi:3-hydroxyacyl-[acyl-carrier-protein] dehydratase
MDLTLPLDYAAIERILPHRYPFLLVDHHRARSRQADRRHQERVAERRYLSRERDESLVLPPTILTEAVAQVGAIMILPNRRIVSGFLFRSIERVRRRPVHPGDVVEIEAVVVRLHRSDGTPQGHCARQRQTRHRRATTFALGRFNHQLS